MAPTTSIHYLFIRQHRAAFRTPVDDALFAVGQTFLKELDKKPLIPSVVFGQAGGDLARPVVSETQATHLRFHGSDVAQRPLARWGVVLDGGVFRRQAE